MKRLKTIFRTQVALFLTLAMTVTLIPAVSETVHADEIMQPPSLSTYVEGNAFTEQDTVYGLTSDKMVQAVYFGTNGSSGTGGSSGTSGTSGTNGTSAQKQKWWIAGYDSSGLVLMCDPQQPLKTNQRFDSSTVNETYRSDYGTYENTSPGEVYPNHYGASDIRDVLRSLATDESYFTKAEQEMMKGTTVYTYDFKNGTTYSTTDKLYLAAGGYNSKEIAVGQNTVDSSKTGNEQVYNGLKISLNMNSVYGSPFTDSDSFNFWTRSSADDMGSLALHAVPSVSVVAGSTTESKDALVPAFALDADSILFASSAAAGTDSAALDNGNAMIFRRDGSAKIGSTVTFTDDSVSVDYDNADRAIYLYVQGSEEDDWTSNDWVYSQRIEGSCDIAASYIRPGANLTNCKVWLETVEDNIAYAKPAEFTGAFPPPLYGIATPPKAKNYTYTGKEISGAHAGGGYSVSGDFFGTSAGTYSFYAILQNGYIWADGTTEPKWISWKILPAANPMKLKPKTATVKRSKLKHKTQKLLRSRVLSFTRSAKGTVTYTKLKGNSKITIAKTTGKVTLKKGLKKGTYKVRVKVRASGNNNYKSASKTVTFTIKVK